MIRLAVAGMAHPHVAYVLDELTHQPDVELVAAADPDPGNQAAYADRLAGLPVYADHNEMFARHRVDVVSVNGVYAHRAAAVVDALRAGADVIADKPLCTSLDQLAEIEAAATQTGGTVSLMFEKRGYPVTIAARRLLDAGMLGDLVLIASTGPHALRYGSRPSWFYTADYGGILGDLAVHDVDMVLTLTGAVQGYVVGSTGARGFPQHPDFDDHGALLLTAGDVTATIDAHWLAPEAAATARYRMRLVGTRGTAELYWSEGRLEVGTHERDFWDEPLPPGRRPAEDFFTAVVAGGEPEVGTAESVDASRIALLAQRSADRGGSAERWAV